MSDPGPPQGAGPAGPQAVAPLVAESCATCFFMRQATYSVPASGVSGAHREDQTLLVCAYSPPVLSTDLRVLEARWPQVRGDYWCGEWSDTGAPVVR